MHAPDFFRAVEIGQRARHAQHAMITARREPHGVGGVAQQRHPAGVRPRYVFQHRARHRRIAADKEGSHYDLPIALGLMAAIGAIPHDALAGFTVLGELGLDGSIAPVAGVLPAAIGANARSEGLMCPAACGPERSPKKTRFKPLAVGPNPHSTQIINLG